MRSSLCYLLLGLLVLGAHRPQAALAEEAVEFLLLEISPLIAAQDGQPTGPVGKQINAILAHSGLAVSLTSGLPHRRILTLMQAPVAGRCSAGWFKTQEREALFRYSLPFYQDKRLLLTTPDKRAQLEQLGSIERIFADQTLRMGIIRGLSYGQALDDKIRALDPVRYAQPGLHQLLPMLIADRLDYTIVTTHSLETSQLASGLKASDFAALNLPDLPEGERRYFICSKATSDATIDRLNQSIRAIATPAQGAE